MAVIRIHDLCIRAIIGTHSWERENKQDIVLNIKVEYNASDPAKSDILKDALNYEAMAENAVRIVKRSRCLLLEKLAAKVLDGIMSDQRILEASVRVDKPQALAQAKSVSVEISKER